MKAKWQEKVQKGHLFQITANLPKVFFFQKKRSGTFAAFYATLFSYAMDNIEWHSKRKNHHLPEHRSKNVVLQINQQRNKIATIFATLIHSN